MNGPMTTTLLTRPAAPTAPTAPTGTALDVLIEEVEPGRVRLSARVPAGGDPLLRLLELTTTATLRSVVGTRGVELLAGRVRELADVDPGATVVVEGDLVELGRRTVIVRATLRDDHGRACRESVLTGIL